MLFKSNFSRGWNVFRCFLLLALFSALLSCAVKEGDDPGVRAGLRWAALVAGDFDRAYEFETPAYRKVYTVRQFRDSFGRKISWKEAKVTGIELKQPDIAAVTVELEYSFRSSGRGMMEDKATHTETWLRVDDQWWHQSQRRTISVEDSKS
jgi:hypothetical protein